VLQIELNAKLWWVRRGHGAAISLGRDPRQETRWPSLVPPWCLCWSWADFRTVCKGFVDRPL